jgi:hypothetical protein
MLLCGGVLLLLAAGRPAVPAPLPLPPEEQEQVNRAIDRGVAFLKATQGRRGTWAAPGAAHAVGYAALPGLTLLECGVSPKDPVLQRTADAIRRTAGQLDATYEISLAILFLDRLGDPKYEPVIEQLAVRLIASQAPTGGWGYKCLSVSKAKQQQILVLLRKQSPPPHAPDLPPFAQGPGAQPPGLAGGPAGQKPTAPAVGPGVAQRGDSPPMGGVAAPPPNDPLRGGTTSSSNPPSPGESLRDTPPSAGPPAKPAPPGQPPERKDRPQPPRSVFPSSQWARCIKSDAPPPSDDLAPELRAQPRGRAEAGGQKAPAGLVVIPPSLRGLTVFQPPDWLGLFDPPDSRDRPLLPTTDNSNSQFAILALWAAQRHGIPMERTLRRVALRYETSQNADGSWGYDYRRGGGAPERPTMTCVGLLGLAVGHGIDQAPAGPAVQDPRLLAGFVALSKHVGTPAGRMQDLPMANLYFLWSVERVAVLYDLQTIGGKDWYRWGAEILVANQQPQGHWANGGYHGASPVLDTSLALLFLKRANLAADLTRKLPFDPAVLNDSIIGKLALSNRPGDTKPDEGKKKALTEPPKPPEPPAKPELTGDTTARSAEPAARPANDSASWEREESTAKRRWPFVLFGLGVLLLIGAIVFVVMHLLAKKEEEREERSTTSRPPSRVAKGPKTRPATKFRAGRAG